MNGTSLDSRTIRTLVLAGVGYLVAKYALPDQFASPMVQGAVADIIVLGGLTLAAWYRKHARVYIKGWFTND